jgi:tetratricopeptide (TPR) repeat protein
MSKNKHNGGKPSAAAQQTQTRFVEAVAAHRNGQIQRAQALYMLILATQPRHIGALHFLGVLHYQTGNPERALNLLDKAIAIYPDDPSAHSNRGNALRLLGDVLGAYESYDRAIQLQADHADALYNRGCVALQLGRAEQALADFQAAQQQQPGNTAVLNNAGAALLALQRPQEALSYFDQALALLPQEIEALNNKAKALLFLQRGAEAIACYEAALVVQPDNADLHTNLGVACLRLGDFARGWPELEWRWQLAGVQGSAAAYRQYPLWLGKEAIAGKRLLVQAEQQLADCIHLFRYVLMLAERGARVTYFVPQGSSALFTGSLRGLDVRVVESIPADTAFDFETPLLSLPLAFGVTVDSIRFADQAYLLPAAWASSRIAPWLQEVPGPRIGLGWGGSSANNSIDSQVPLSGLLASMPESISLVSLPELAALPAPLDGVAHSGWHDFGAQLKDNADLAALIADLDLVITGDGLIAHLAAALGKPTWLLLPCFSDWRWMEGRDDSPWYASLKLYRQATAGDWSAVLQQVKQDIATRFT